MKCLRFVAALALFFLFIPAAMAQVDLSTNVGVEIPVTTGGFTIGTGLYSGATITVAMPFHPDLGLLADVTYSGHRFGGADYVNFINGQLGLSYAIPLVQRLSLTPHLSTGYFFNWSSEIEETGGNLNAAGGLDFDFMFSRIVGLKLRGDYRMYFGETEPFFSSVVVSLGLNVSPGSGSRDARIQIMEPERDILFPIYRYYYDSNPLGSVSILNEDDETLTNLEVKFFAPDYMREPKMCAGITELDPGETVTLDLFALFNESILEVLEGSRTDGKVIVEYSFRKDVYTRDRTDTYEISFRNGMRWSDDRSAACFVTAKDPFVLGLGKRISGLATGEEFGQMPENIAKAAAIYSFVDLAGIRYVVDPNTPYQDFSGDTTVIDYLQFPIQTLAFYSGDCDDLSILYCSLLEGMGVRTAFVTVPGHIYIAFDTCIGTGAFERLFGGSRECIDVDGMAWVPVEVTSIGEGFDRAWERGIRQWTDNPASRGFYDLASAWALYPPVQPTFEIQNDFAYRQEDLPETVSSEINVLVGSTVARVSGPLKRRLESNPSDSRTRGALGVLYARFGMYDDAEGHFKAAYDSGGSRAMLVNLGNIAYLRRDYAEAVRRYEQASAGGTINAGAMKALSESYKRIGSYEDAERVEATLARSANGSESGGRAGTGSERQEGLVWMEE